MATAKIILYESKTLSDDRHPIMLRVSHKKDKKYFSLDMSALKSEWDGSRFKSSRKRKDEIDGYNSDLNDIDEDVKEILRGFNEIRNPFTFEKFEIKFRGGKTTLFKYFNKRINELKKTSDIGNAIVYQETLNALKKCFVRDCPLEGIDNRFLKKFETHFRTKEKPVKGNTIYLRMRTLRALLNNAIENGYMKQSFYPFKNINNPKGYKMSELKSSTKPRALKKFEVDKIRDLDLKKYPHLKDARNYFMFSYWGAGINFTDMARLTVDNVSDEHITYTRKKTMKKNPDKTITFKLLPPALEILMNDYKYPFNYYLFPVLNEDVHKTEAQKVNRIKKVRKKLNKDLKTIAGILEIDTNITSYFARHSFATNLRPNFKDSEISEALGHADERTTTNYLDSFGKEKLDEMQETLL